MGLRSALIYDSQGVNMLLANGIKGFVYALKPRQKPVVYQYPEARGDFDVMELFEDDESVRLISSEAVYVTVTKTDDTKVNHLSHRLTSVRIEVAYLGEHVLTIEDGWCDQDIVLWTTIVNPTSPIGHGSRFRFGSRDNDRYNHTAGIFVNTVY